MSYNGAFGSSIPAPPGFIPPGADVRNSPACNKGKIGFVADPDKDGWAIGNPAYIGEYFLPGTPEEGWAVSMNGVDYNNNRSTEYIGPGNYCSPGTQIPGAFVSFQDLPDKQIAVWEGMLNGMKIVKTTTLPKDKLFFTTEVQYINQSPATLTDVYYMRNVDPDNEVVLTENYKTNNRIEFQNPFSNNKALVSARGTEFNSYLGLGTIDCRAKVCFNGSPGYLVNRSPRDVFNSIDPRKGGLNDRSLFDAAIAISFRLGNILPDDTVSFRFAYILSVDDLGEGLNSTAPQFFIAGAPVLTGGAAIHCVGSTMPLTITGGDDYAWTWSPATGLNTTTGASVIYTQQPVPVTYTVTGVSAICTEAKLKVSIYPPNTPIANFDIEDTCGSRNITFVNLSPESQYEWDFGDGTKSTSHSPVHTFPAMGDYNVTLKLINPNVLICGNGLVTTRTISVREKPTPEILYSNNACEGRQINLQGSASVAGGTITGHKWTVQGGPDYFTQNISHTFPSPGSYIIFYDVTSSKGCVATAKRTIVVESNPVAGFSIENGCAGQPLVIKNSSTNTTGNITTYKWNFNGTPTLMSDQPDARFALPGDYPVQLTVGTANGCEGTISNTVNIQSQPVAEFRNTPACLDLPVQFTNMTTNIAGPITSYDWDFGNGVKSQVTHPAYTFTSERIYRVSLTAVSSNGCVSIPRTHALRIARTKAFAGRDTFVFKDTPFRLRASGGTTYSWTPPTYLDNADTSAPIAKINADQAFQVTIVDERGCIDDDIINVKVFLEDDIYVPNMFTPNNDGRNDLFRAIAPPGTISIFEVYNRWGQRVFSTTDATKGWDGKINGVMQTTGVFAWFLRAKNRKGELIEKKGTVTLTL